MYVTATVFLATIVVGLSAVTKGSVGPIADSAWNASVVVNLAATHPVSETLYGIFFEEIGHAGEGGLYAELVQDRSFDAISRATGFSTSSASAHVVNLLELAARHRGARENITRQWHDVGLATTKAELLAQHPGPQDAVIVAWQPLPGTITTLVRDHPLNPHNAVAMALTGPANGKGGLINHGYWGVHVEQGRAYVLALHARAPDSSPLTLTAALMNVDLNVTLASAELGSAGEDWGRLNATLRPTSTDSGAVLVISFDGPGSVILDVVTLFPSQNVEQASKMGEVNPWPFREDLLEALKDLKPAFMRFPGGCYIEGDYLVNRFNWKNTVGPLEERPGHLNAVWGYWSTDGLGLFEYMQLAEALNTEPVWVINNGIAHAQSVHGADIWPYVQDALDSLEFILGAPDTEWGAVRARMGRVEPWVINYMAIGNEDCGKWMYLNNYIAFFSALRTRYPHLRLISNCDMGNDAPTDIWDWHIYTNPRDLFNKRHIFDGRRPEAGHFVFASEYAVTAGGGWGNLVGAALGTSFLLGAVAEAAFMTGLEHNSQAVIMASYAPLFVHTSNRPWPTNMIVIDNHRWYGIPSYHVQRLFREAQGTHYADTAVTNSPTSQVIQVRLQGLTSAQRVKDSGNLVYLSSAHPEDENTFDQPHKVYPASTSVSGLADKFDLDTRPYSVNLLTISLAGGSPSVAMAVA